MTEPLPLGVVEPHALGAALLAQEREPAPLVELGPNELTLLAALAWPARRREWLAGRAAAKTVLRQICSVPLSHVEILPGDAGEPTVYIAGVRRTDLYVSISHTRRYALAAVAPEPVGVDACDDEDGERLLRVARRVFNDGEAEACAAYASRQTQAAVWAMKEAGLKLRGGGVLRPGARSVWVESISPARAKTLRVALFRLPHAAVAVAREPLGV